MVFLNQVTPKESTFILHFSQFYLAKMFDFIFEVYSTFFKVEISTCWKYRVSRAETWLMVNSFECFLSCTVLDIKNLFQLILLHKYFTQTCFTLKSILLWYDCIYYSLCLQTTWQIMEERHLKLFTICHVSWDTLYFCLTILLFILKINLISFLLKISSIFVYNFYSF